MGLFKKILGPVSVLLKNFNELKLDEGASIHPSVKLKGATLKGNITIAGGSKISNGVSIDAIKEVRIGRNTSITGPNTDIKNLLNPVLIGSFTSIARNVTIQEFNHKVDRVSTYFMEQNIFGGKITDDVISKGGIVIGNDVWIGTQTVILSGSKIGHGAIIAANSVVSGDIPPYAIAGGSPARVIKYRFTEDIIEALLEINWWDWEIDKIKDHRELFLNVLDVSVLTKLKVDSER